MDICALLETRVKVNQLSRVFKKVLKDWMAVHNYADAAGEYGFFVILGGLMLVFLWLMLNLSAVRFWASIMGPLTFY